MIFQNFICCHAGCNKHGICFNFGTFTTMLFLIHQSWKFFKSVFRLFERFKIDGSQHESVASSANRSRMQVCIDIGKSLSHLLIAGCDIGVQISVRPYVRSSVRSSVNIYVKVWFSLHQ